MRSGKNRDTSRFSRVVHPDGSTVTHSYERAYNRRTSTIDENGVETRYQYLQNGNLSRKIEAAGTAEERVTEYGYDTANNLTLIRLSGVGATTETRMDYDASDNLVTLTDAEGNVTRMTHDIYGNVLTRTDANEKVWRYAYDAAGNLLKITDPLTHERSFEYDPLGRRIKAIDALNHETVFEYDRRGHLIRSVDPLLAETRYVYDNDGRLIRSVDAEGHEKTYAYDLDGRMIRSTDGSGNATALEYASASGSCASCSGAANNPSRIVFPTFSRDFGYDKRDRKTSETDIAGLEALITRYEYDPAGNLILKTDREGRSTTYGYDPLNRLKSVTDPLNGRTLYSYDGRGNLTSLTDAEGRITRFEYDRNNRLVKEIRPLGQETRYTYDANGNLSEKIDAKNQKTAYGYDDANRLVLIRYYTAATATTPEKTVAFTYDANGRLKTYDDGTTSATYDYDLAGRKIAETVNYGSFSLTTSATYYKNGAKQSLTYPDGTTVEYAYDASDKLQAVNLPNVGAVTISEYQWMRPKTLTLPGGSQKDYEYDPFMRLTRINVQDPGNNPLLNYQYSYDKMDNITSKATEQGDTSYSYDPLYRLTGADHPAQSNESFTYDHVGNRLTSAATTGNWNYNRNNELQGVDSDSYQYDLNGNTVRITQGGVTRHLFYNLEDRLARVENDSGQTIGSYYYDPFGRRLWKEVDGTRTCFLYGDEGLLGEYDATGTAIKTYGWKPNSTWSTDPLYMQQAGSTYFYHNDHLGTPQKMTTSTGAVVWSAQYTAFGKAEVETGSTVENNLRFPGQYEDAETGWHYNWQRYYNPTTGRYITADPIGFEGGVNLYAYAWNDPVNFYDPEGLLFGGRVDAGESYGDYAALYWAQKFNNPNNSFAEDIFYALMGGLASLWTPCTSDETALTLASFAPIGKWFGRPFWRYVGPKSKPYSPWMTRGAGWEAPYGTNFEGAKDALQMPFKPTGVEKVNVPWHSPVRGPRPAIKHPEWGSGGGPEYGRGWKWPD